MRILIVGSGGREHALAWKLAQSPHITRLFVAPGNGGTARVAENVDIADADLPALVAFTLRKKIDLVVAGPELPLVLGLADALAQEGIPCFGPDAFAAQLEGSKAFAKTVMRAAGVPTADFMVFDDHLQARAHVLERPMPCVIKADGLAAGKGVVVCKTREEALETLDEMMLREVFGAAGERVVVEDALAGEEASFLAFCDGTSFALMPSSQDHKAALDGDLGPNTGGMGAYSPAPVLPEADCAAMGDLVIRPILDYMAASGHPFVGILYAGLMFTPAGPRVLEYNVRFGDPECQPLLMRLDGDLLEIMLACTRGTLAQTPVRWKPQSALCVVMAAGGYPKSYPKGMEITGIDRAEAETGVTVFQAGTRAQDGRTLCSGGRVLGVTALGDTLAQARDAAYKGVELIHFDPCHYRRDIGSKGLGRR